VAIGAHIAPRSVFARKNYFYPDLPKGYQISQYELPIVGKGQITIELEDGSKKVIGVTRAHLEEDAGKSLHENFHGMTGIDLNRAGTPLLEIVSEPDMRSAAEAVAYMKKIHSIVKYLEICDGNMQEGSFRCDANVSVRPKGQEEYGTRAELKNINSFRFVERAINHEVERQIDIIESGGKIAQETRLYDSDNNTTRSMRSKEEAMDYRYFPDPDLLPVDIEPSFIDDIKQTLPEMPDDKKNRFMSDFDLNDNDANTLIASKELADYYETTVELSGNETRLSANWVIVELSGTLNKEGIELNASPVSAQMLGGMIKRIADDTISGKIAKQVFESMWNGEGSADEIIQNKGLKQVTDTGAIEKIIDDIISANPQQVEQFRGGKDKVFGFFVGQVMKQTQGKANPKQVNELLRKKLSS
jgi:aspartyl-tRNA(Asn)/glutamyl-tRNA(Gln) amidotransferase subunit B